MERLPHLRVVAAVMRDAAQRVLVSQRPAGKHMAGYWEFPGGKIAAGESGQEALARELREELGIEVLAARAWLEVNHVYPDRIVDLGIYLVDNYDGAPVGREGQAIRWVAMHELHSLPLLPADAPIVQKLSTLGS